MSAYLRLVVTVSAGCELASLSGIAQWKESFTAVRESCVQTELCELEGLFRGAGEGSLVERRD